MKRTNEQKGYLLTKTTFFPYLLPAYHRSAPFAVVVPPFLLIAYPLTTPSKFLLRAKNGRQVE